MSGLLEGRRALVTGGAGAIGRAVAHRFAGQGAAVAVADLDQGAADAVAQEVAAAHGVPAVGLAVDVADRASVEAAAAAVEERLGVCDVVVPNAGVLVLAPALELGARDWARVLDVNLTGAFHTAAVFAGRLVATGSPGSVVFTSSLFGVRGGPGNGAYSASKFGVIGLAQSMAAELAPAGVRVNTVCPGQVSSQMLEDLFAARAAEAGTTPEQERAAFVARIPLGRLAQPEDIADAAVFLSSNLARFLTGVVLPVDGGRSI